MAIYYLCNTFLQKLKGRWPQFQARAPPISFLTNEGRAAAANPPPSIYIDINKTSRGIASHRKKLAFPEVFTGNRCFSEIQATCPLGC